MVVAGDGDYFKPIKDIFGIETEDEEESDKDKKDKVEISKKSSSDKKSFKSGERYELLSDDVDGKDVKHYRLTIDMGEFFGLIMDELSTDSDYNYDEYNNEDYDLDWENYEEPELESMLRMAMMLLGQMSDFIDGEMYFDVYFEGNEIVQIVIGYDYGKLLENLYEYMLDEAKDELDEEDINSVDDLASMVVAEFETILDEDALYDMIMDLSNGEMEKGLSEFGIKEKDIKDAIDFNNDKLSLLYIGKFTSIEGIFNVA